MSEPCTAVREYSALGHGRRDRMQRHRRRVYASVRGCVGVCTIGGVARTAAGNRVYYLNRSQPPFFVDMVCVPARLRASYTYHAHTRTHTRPSCVGAAVDALGGRRRRSRR